MTMLKPVLLALSLLLVAPALVHADEITLIPAVKLQIGDRDDYGRYWDGDRVRMMIIAATIAMTMTIKVIMVMATSGITTTTNRSAPGAIPGAFRLTARGV